MSKYDIIKKIFIKNNNMWFENQKFNTSTAERVTWTIQDKIDEKKLKISQVTKENLRNLKVEILYKKSSSLRVRDSEGKVIWRLKNDQNVDFNWEIKKAHWKLFLWVNLAKNKKWFVSADYVKWEINTEVTMPVAVTQKKEEKTSDVKTSVKPVDELSDSEETAEVAIEDESSSEEKEAVENIKSISEALGTFKEIAKDSEKLMTDSEYREERNIMILSALKDLNLAIEKESSKENPNKKEINQAKLYLAKYFSDMTEDWVDNKHWRNYWVSSNIALSILPDENKPEPITEETINNEIVKNKGLMHFIKSSANSWWSAEEKLLNIYKTSAWQEMIEWLQDKYEDELEEYLEWVDSENLDEEQKSALDLLKDVNWVWFLDFKEENFDIFQDVWANLWIIAAWMWSWAALWLTWWTAVPGIGNLIGFIWWAIVWWTISTLWLAWYNQDSDLLNWKEFWINIATMWAIWWAAKIWKSVSNISKLWKHWWKVWLWTEMTADVLWVWVWIDILRSELYEEYEFNFSDSFISNLQWALLPLAMRWANNAKSKIPKEWAEKSNEVIAKLKLAKLTKISWWDNKKILEELDESLAKTRPEIEAKVSKWDDAIKGEDTVGTKEITSPKKTIKNHQIPNISAKWKVDIDNPNLWDRVRVGDDIYEYRKYESTPWSNWSYAWFKEVDWKVVVDVTTPQFNYTHQLKDKLGWNTKVNESRYNERDNYELNRDNGNKDWNIVNPTKKEMELIEEQVDKLPKNPEWKESYSSTPVKFYKWEDWKVYIKTLDNKFYNNWVEVDTSKIKLSEIWDKDNFGKQKKELQKKEKTETREKDNNDNKPLSEEFKFSNNITSVYERNRFESIIKSRLDKDWVTTIEVDWKTTTIKKEFNWKYSINWSNETYSLKDIFKKIDNETILSFLNNSNLEYILKNSEWKEISYGKWNNKVKIKDWEMIVWKDWVETKVKDTDEQLKIISDPKIRMEILWTKIFNINEDNVISNMISWLTKKQKELFDKMNTWTRENLKNSLKWTKDFMLNLTYRWFGEWWPALRGKLFYFWGTAITSWEELNTLFDSINNKDDTIFKLSNADEVISILSNFFLFKHLWLIRGFAYEWWIDKVFEYLAWNE